MSRSATVFGVGATWLRRRFLSNLTWLPSGAPAETVQRHEFVRILLEWASAQGVLGNGPSRPEITEAQSERLQAVSEHIRPVLRQNGIKSAGDALDAIQRHAVAQERATGSQDAMPRSPAVR